MQRMTFTKHRACSIEALYCITDHSIDALTYVASNIASKAMNSKDMKSIRISLCAHVCSALSFQSLLMYIASGGLQVGAFTDGC